MRIPALFLLLFAAATPAEERPPNILFVLADDLGWMDLHCQGNDAVHTPRIDTFAKEGMRFTSAYAAAPVCSPTRAAIMTGQAPARLHITNHLPDRKGFTPKNAKLQPAVCKDRLALEYTTVAEHLKQGGYDTAFFGKWHIGPKGFWADQQGFDVNLGGCAYGGPPTFFDPYKIPNLPKRREGEYLPDRLSDETIAYMKDRDAPFAIFLWYYTVHWPMEAPKEFLAKYKDHQGPGLNDYRYGAMIEAMDTAFGRILSAIDEQGLRDNTLVVFTSDNGGFAGVADNRPLRDAKGSLYEGGIRVPQIVRWPGRVKAGTVDDTPVISTDWFPTLLDLAGVKPATTPVDGASLRGLLGGEELKREAIYFHYPNYAWHRSNRLGSAIRMGDYKLIEWLDDGSVELYNLARDIGEKKNIRAAERHRAGLLVNKLRAWRKSVGANMPGPGSRPAP